MKKIILVRHGKSAWDDPNLTDHDRPLADRGLEDIPEMGLRLKDKGLIPDLMISSTAIRASQTAEILAEVLHLPKSKIVYDKNLYHASYAMILKCIQRQDDENELIFVVGHNPGMNDFIDFLDITVGSQSSLDLDHVRRRPENAARENSLARHGIGRCGPCTPELLVIYLSFTISFQLGVKISRTLCSGERADSRHWVHLWTQLRGLTAVWLAADFNSERVPTGEQSTVRYCDCHRIGWRHQFIFGVPRRRANCSATAG